MKPVAPKPKFELFLGKVRILMNTLKKHVFQRIGSRKHYFKVLADRVIWCLRKTKLKHFSTNGITS